MSTNVNFNIDVQKLAKSLLGRSARNDLAVVVENGTLRNAKVHWSIDPGGHGEIAELKGNPDISPIDDTRPSVTANFCGLGIHAVGAGSNVLIQIPIADRVVDIICATPVNKENYSKHRVVHSLHTPEATRVQLEKREKNYANEGDVEIAFGAVSIWVSMTATSPAMCKIQLRETTDRITYGPVSVQMA